MLVLYLCSPPHTYDLYYVGEVIFTTPIAFFWGGGGGGGLYVLVYNFSGHFGMASWV